MSPSIGTIYVLSNPSLQGMYKIGFTSEQDAEGRALQLSQSTAIPTAFEIEYQSNVENPQQYERLAHARLAEYRVSQSKEFFKADIDVIFEAINMIIYGTTDMKEILIRDIQQQAVFVQKFPEKYAADVPKQMDGESNENFKKRFMQIIVEKLFKDIEKE